MRLIAVFAACVMVMTGCGDDAGTSAGAPSAPASTSPSETPLQPETSTPTLSSTSRAATPENRTRTVIKAAKSQFGMMLFDGTGQAIYLFDKEQTTKPECYGACAEAGPPVLTERTPTAKNGTRQNLLGTTKRNRRQDPGDVRRPSAVLLRPRGQERGEVPQHPGVRRPLAGRHSSRAVSCTLTRPRRSNPRLLSALVFPNVIHDERRNGVCVGAVRLLRKIEDGDHELHGIRRGPRAGTHQHAINEEVGIVRRPVHRVGMEVGYIDRQARVLKVSSHCGIAERA
jgi:hypothetical protein